jgi:hypothetical protein
MAKVGRNDMEYAKADISRLCTEDCSRFDYANLGKTCEMYGDMKLWGDKRAAPDAVIIAKALCNALHKGCQDYLSDNERTEIAYHVLRSARDSMREIPDVLCQRIILQALHVAHAAVTSGNWLKYSVNLSTRLKAQPFTTDSEYIRSVDTIRRKVHDGEIDLDDTIRALSQENDVSELACQPFESEDDCTNRFSRIIAGTNTEPTEHAVSVMRARRESQRSVDTYTEALRGLKSLDASQRQVPFATSESRRPQVTSSTAQESVKSGVKEAIETQLAALGSQQAPHPPSWDKKKVTEVVDEQLRRISSTPALAAQQSASDEPPPPAPTSAAQQSASDEPPSTQFSEAEARKRMEENKRFMAEEERHQREAEEAERIKKIVTDPRVDELVSDSPWKHALEPRTKYVEPPPDDIEAMQTFFETGGECGDNDDLNRLLESASLVEYLTSGLLRDTGTARTLCMRFIEELQDPAKGTLVSNSDGTDYVNFRMYHPASHPAKYAEAHSEALVIHGITPQYPGDEKSTRQIQRLYLPNADNQIRGEAVARHLNTIIDVAIAGNKSWITNMGDAWCFLEFDPVKRPDLLPLSMFILRYLVTGALVVYLQGDNDESRYNTVKENILWAGFNDQDYKSLMVISRVVYEEYNGIKFPSRFEDIVELMDWGAIIFHDPNSNVPIAEGVSSKLRLQFESDRPSEMPVLVKRLKKLTVPQDDYQEATALVFDHAALDGALIQEPSERHITIHTVDWGGRGDCLYPAILGYDNVEHSLELRRAGLITELAHKIENFDLANRLYEALESGMYVDLVPRYNAYVARMSDEVIKLLENREWDGKKVEPVYDAKGTESHVPAHLYLARTFLKSVSIVNDNLAVALSTLTMLTPESIYDAKRRSNVTTVRFEDKRQTGTYAEDDDIKFIAKLLNITINLFMGTKQTLRNTSSMIDVYTSGNYPQDLTEATWVPLDSSRAQFVRVVPYMQYSPVETIATFVGAPGDSVPRMCVNVLRTNSLFTLIHGDAVQPGILHFVPVALYKSNERVDTARDMFRLSMKTEEIRTLLDTKMRDYAKRELS